MTPEREVLPPDVTFELSCCSATYLSTWLWGKKNPKPNFFEAVFLDSLFREIYGLCESPQEPNLLRIQGPSLIPTLK